MNVGTRITVLLTFATHKKSFAPAKIYLEAPLYKSSENALWVKPQGYQARFYCKNALGTLKFRGTASVFIGKVHAVPLR